MWQNILKVLWTNPRIRLSFATLIGGIGAHYGLDINPEIVIIVVGSILTGIGLDYSTSRTERKVNDERRDTQ